MYLNGALSSQDAEMTLGWKSKDDPWEGMLDSDIMSLAIHI